jgi:putative transposase
MARLARFVVPGLPHHVTQRGNQGQRVFFDDRQYGWYLRLISDAATRAQADIWAYCLMPNHVHFVVAPQTEDGLRRTFSGPHKRYAAAVNERRGLTGHFWQGRFASYAMDERHLMAAVRYVELNPVRSGLVKRAEDWRWSSARAHLDLVADPLVNCQPMWDRVEDYVGYLDAKGDPRAEEALRRSYATGQPLGDAVWVRALEVGAGR